jgi:hypothetical protein
MWIAAIKMHLGEEWLNLGTAGPALAAMFLSSRRDAGPSQSSSTRRLAWFILALASCWVVLSLHYLWRGSQNLEWRLSPLLLVPALLPAWVLSGAVSRNAGVRGLVGQLVYRPNGWSLFAFLSFPAFMLIPAGIVGLFGGRLVWPQDGGPIGVRVAKAAMFWCYNILFVAVLEEPGWRGFLGPVAEPAFTASLDNAGLAAVGSLAWAARLLPAGAVFAGELVVAAGRVPDPALHHSDLVLQPLRQIDSGDGALSRQHEYLSVCAAVFDACFWAPFCMGGVRGDRGADVAKGGESGCGFFPRNGRVITGAAISSRLRLSNLSINLLAHRTSKVCWRSIEPLSVEAVYSLTFQPSNSPE